MPEVGLEGAPLTCFVADREINRWLVQQGWAVAREDAPSAYAEAESIARDEGRGQWRRKWEKPEEVEPLNLPVLQLAPAE